MVAAFWLTLLAAAGMTAAAEEAPSPKAVFVENSWRFEVVLEGEEVSHDFVVRNEGNAPLEISKVQTG
jgi:hypothetical protein